MDNMHIHVGYENRNFQVPEKGRVFFIVRYETASDAELEDKEHKKAVDLC